MVRGISSCQCIRPSLHYLQVLCWPLHPRQQHAAQITRGSTAWICPKYSGALAHCAEVIAGLTVPDLFQTRTQPSMEPVASMVPADCQSIHSTTEHLSDSAPECAKIVGTIASPDCDVVDHNKASGSPSLRNKAPQPAMTCQWGICRAAQSCCCWRLLAMPLHLCCSVHLASHYLVRSTHAACCYVVAILGMHCTANQAAFLFWSAMVCIA